MNRTRTQTWIVSYQHTSFRFPTSSYAPISLYSPCCLYTLAQPVNRSYTKEDNSPRQRETGGRLELGSTAGLDVTSLGLLVVDDVPDGGEVLRTNRVSEYTVREGA